MSALLLLVQPHRHRPATRKTPSRTLQERSFQEIVEGSWWKETEVDGGEQMPSVPPRPPPSPSRDAPRSSMLTNEIFENL